MAFGAVLSEAILMHVPVTVCTTCVGNGFEKPGFLSIPGDGPVAKAAIDALVLSQQPETGIIMVESGCGPETLIPVAIGAVQSQEPLVVIVVAVHALLPESQVGALPIPEFLVPYVLFFVALAAIDPSMGSLKCIPREPVVELVPVKTDHLEIAAMVVVMAGGTLLVFYIGGDMITPVAINPRSNLPVAVQAFFVGYLLSQDMAFDAVGHPFQVGVGLCQVPRTKLGEQRACRP